MVDGALALQAGTALDNFSHYSREGTLWDRGLVVSRSEHGDGRYADADAMHGSGIVGQIDAARCGRSMNSASGFLRRSSSREPRWMPRRMRKDRARLFEAKIATEALSSFAN